MMKLKTTIVSLLLSSVWLLGCDESTEPVEAAFDWSGVVAQGDQIEIKGVNGDVLAAPATGSEVVVSAVKVANESDPSQVSIEVITHAAGVTICAVYPDVPGEPANECLPGDQGQMAVQDNDVEVDFLVSVPVGVVFVGRTVNGDVAAEQMLSDAYVSTVNGNAVVSTTDQATASTVNGFIDAVVGSANWDRGLEFTTVNGNVTVQIPLNTNAEVHASTVNGVITSDFSLTEVAPGVMQGVIGIGGPMLTLSTVNGNITLFESS
jgi:hypothetical protein